VRRTLAALTGATIVALALVPAAAPAATGSSPRGCDPLDAKRCLLPWPNNAFTVSDVRTDTGRRVRLLPTQMPKNAKGRRIDPTDFNRADGFSPGSSILTYVPNLSLKKTGAVPVTNLRKALDRTQPIAVVNARTGARTLIWAEMDTTSKPGERLLIIHPAKNLSRGQRYIVALSNLKDAKGRLLKAPASFRVFRDQLQTKSRVQERRRLTFEKNFTALAKAGIKRKSLYLAWDFTVASTRNITERSLAIRDNAFAVLGDVNLVDRQVKGGAPRFALDAPQEFAPCGSDGCQAGESDLLARKVTGTMTVPCYLDKKGCPVGSRFRYEHLKKTATFQANRFVYVPDRIKDNTMQVPFTCIVPRAALSKPSRPVLYGHAQFSGQDDVLRPDVQALAQDGDITFCAAREAGYASEDAALLRSSFADASRFAQVADRLQQGAINTLMLGRLMIHPQGLVSQPAFRTPAGGPAVDTFELSYDTTSGGAFGGMLTALSPDAVRASLGTGGMNYNLMLPRSINFKPFEAGFATAYPSRLDRMLILSMLQGQWDRAETDGYAQSLTQDPLPNTPLHTLLFQAAVGDHQVPTVATEIEARSVEAVVRQPEFDAGRSADLIPGYALTETSQLELGSVLTMWDGGPVRDGGASGTPIATAADVPLTAGKDPHDLPAQTPDARKQRSDFMHPDARFVDPCPPARACRAAGWGY